MQCSAVQCSAEQKKQTRFWPWRRRRKEKRVGRRFLLSLIFPSFGVRIISSLFFPIFIVIVWFVLYDPTWPSTHDLPLMVSFFFFFFNSSLFCIVHLCDCRDRFLLFPTQTQTQLSGQVVEVYCSSISRPTRPSPRPLFRTTVSLFRTVLYAVASLTALPNAFRSV